MERKSSLPSAGRESSASCKRRVKWLLPKWPVGLNVSIDTIRRDLNQLAQEGLIQRVHGGGLPASPALNPVLQRQFNSQTKKLIIAEKAATTHS